jgi:uncharacterized membrane protein YhaH (DUF805 family)
MVGERSGIHRSAALRNCWAGGRKAVLRPRKSPPVLTMDRQVTACGGQRLGHSGLGEDLPGRRLKLALLCTRIEEATTVKRLWRDYNLSVVLGLLFVTTWIGQLISQWFNWANEQQEHNQPLQVGSFLWQFWESTLENWQSEFLQLFSFVVLASLFIHKGSAESKDSDEQMQQSLDRIEKRLKALEGEAKTGAKSS